jgi:hypothetical protein
VRERALHRQLVLIGVTIFDRLLDVTPSFRAPHRKIIRKKKKHLAFAVLQIFPRGAVTIRHIGFSVLM